MKFFKIKLPFIALLCLLSSISIAQQIPGCPYDTTLSATFTFGVFDAENKINSDMIVFPNTSIEMSAGKSICLNPGFEVFGGEFDAYIEGCEAECEAEILCNETPCNNFSTESDSNGNEYVKHQVVITFPDSVFVFLTQGNILTIDTSGFQQFITISLDQIMMNAFAPSIFPPGPGTTQQCICGQNIFLYENNDLIINEGGIQPAHCPEVTKEGGQIGLNYIISYDLGAPFSNFNSDNENIGQKSNGNPNASTIAFIDGGINSDFVPFNTILEINSSVICQESPAGGTVFTSDPYGFNFIDNNNNIDDENGHGTAVVASYFEAVDKLPTINPSDTKVLTVKSFDECGVGTIYSVVCGLQYAKVKQADFVNNSWGMYFNERQIQRAIEELDRAGIYMTNSAGNSSEDLDAGAEHYPSGYSVPFEYIIDEFGNVSSGPDLFHVYEVGAVCRDMKDACINQPVNMPLWSFSNYREDMFVEPGVSVEEILCIPNTSPPFCPFEDLSCSVSGTSFATPMFMAGLVQEVRSFTGTVDKSHMQSISKPIHPDDTYLSYFLNNCL